MGRSQKRHWKCSQALVFLPFIIMIITLGRGFAVMNETTECLIGFKDVPDADKNGGPFQCTDCDPTCDADHVNTANRSCVFKLEACVNQAEGSCTAAPIKTVKVSGKCKASALTPAPSGTSPTCGPSTSLTVKRKCRVVAKAVSSDNPKKVDKDVLTLVCKRRPKGQPCPTTTTLPPSLCSPIDPTNPAITGAYQTVSLPATDAVAIKLCTTDAKDATKTFGPCSTDTDCGAGSDAGTCAQTPWVDAGGVVQATGKATTAFAVTAGAFPTCEHTVCIQCGNVGKCPDIQGGCDNCGEGGPACTASSSNVNCPITDQCCQSPGFMLEALLIGPGILNFCTRVNQTACGFGVINTSNPQTGDNEVKREADTSDPGADCQYGTADDPTGKACNQFSTGQGNDVKGLVRVSKGNGAADAAGVQIRYLTPGVATTWTDSGGCTANATFDNGESIISQLPQSAEPSTAGASGTFVDLNKDGCKRVGAGFTNLPNPPQDQAAAGVPYTIEGGPAGSATSAATAMPYGGGKYRSVTIGAAFSGATPLFDVGFVAVTPNGALTFQGAAEACTCPAVHPCPECDAGSAVCPTCKGPGTACAAGAECCSNTCSGGICS